MPPCLDLHAHTTFSDGRLDPAELVQRAASAGVEVLAVTDHDTTDGILPALEAAPPPLRVLPGIEISARHRGRGLHLLGYFTADALPRLQGWQAERRRARRERVVAMIERLAAVGAPVDPARVWERDEPRRMPGRPDLARALLAAGHVASWQEAFDRYLGAGRPAYVPTRGPDAREAIELVHSLGGIAVVAHPALDGHGAHLDELAALGVDGVEAYHSAHSTEVAEGLCGRARALGLVVSGGSDFHGVSADAAPLGSVRWPAAERERFLMAYEGATK
ncbi:MAG: PHP domain-containing protein [Planctomycetota bacterium]|nr:MAG: PHP domain-containing protein [Planctomycetota bacterium]